jgi:hypothetical protein
LTKEATSAIMEPVRKQLWSAGMKNLLCLLCACAVLLSASGLVAQTRDPMVISHGIGEPTVWNSDTRITRQGYEAGWTQQTRGDYLYDVKPVFGQQLNEFEIVVTRTSDDRTMFAGYSNTPFADMVNRGNCVRLRKTYDFAGLDLPIVAGPIMHILICRDENDNWIDSTGTQQEDLYENYKLARKVVRNRDRSTADTFKFRALLVKIEVYVQYLHGGNPKVYDELSEWKDQLNEDDKDWLLKHRDLIIKTMTNRADLHLRTIPLHN